MQSTGTITLVSGLRTERIQDEEPRGLQVTWITWDSGFRGSGLLEGDIITAVDGRPVAVEDEATSAREIGRYQESAGWGEAGAREGQIVRLTVDRWGAVHTFEGRLQAERFHQTADGRRALAPGGPDRSARDGFTGSWGSWFEGFQKRLSLLFTQGWNRSGFNNRRELTAHEEDLPRVQFLEEHHPGPFAAAVRGDYERGRRILEGEPVPLGPDDLAYRELSTQRLERARELATHAWEAFRTDVDADAFIAAFPAPDPDHREEVVGRLVELPWVGHRQMINDLGRSILVAGSLREGHWFVDLESPTMDRYFDALFHFKGLVHPDLRERHRLVGRVLDHPMMVTVDGRPEEGLLLDVVAGSAGDGEFFVDLRGGSEGRPAWAGEEELTRSTGIELPADAPPEAVVHALVEAVKQGDLTTWTSLFADWRLWNQWGGEPLVEQDVEVPESNFIRAWEDSRRTILGDVYDARVSRVDRVRVLAQGDPRQERPRVEEVVVWLDHVGLFDGEYRTFTGVAVTRRWPLQRLDGGPWKIVEPRRL